MLERARTLRSLANYLPALTRCAGRHEIACICLDIRDEAAAAAYGPITTRQRVGRYLLMFAQMMNRNELCLTDLR